jgi:hypothetical protein
MQNISTGNVKPVPITNLPVVYDFFTDSYTIYSNGTTDFNPDDFKLDTSDLASAANFVDPETGDDANDGLSWASAFKTVTHAYKNGDRGIIVLRSGARYYEPAMWPVTYGVSRQVTIITDSTEPATIIGGPDDISGGFSVSSGRTGVYQAALDEPISAWDETATSIGLDGKWGLLEEQSSIDSVESNGGWYHDGTLLYVKMFDSRAPDSNLRLQTHDLISLGVGLESKGNYRPTYVENVNFYCIRMRPFFYGSAFLLNGCEVAYAGDSALISSETSSAGNGSAVYLLDCHIHSGVDDLLSTTGANRSVYINTIAEYAYRLTGSTNAATNHINGVVIGINSVFANTKHNVVGDTTGAGGDLYVQCRAYKDDPIFETVDYAAWKFNNEATDTSLGIFIGCTDKDNEGNRSLGGSFYAQGNCSLQDSDFRQITTSDDATVDTDTQYYNPAPTATVGDSVSGDVVTLSATDIGDPVGKPTALLWSLSKPTGSSASLSSTTGNVAVFTMDEDGDYGYQLTVTNSSGDESVYTGMAEKSSAGVESTLNATLTGIPDGTYKTRVIDTDNDVVLFLGDKSWASESASFTLTDVPVGTNVEYYAHDDTNAGLDVGVTE